MSLSSALYVGSVFHRRFSPKAHYFRYRLCWLYVDLDELPALDRALRFFSHNRANLFALNDRDHGDGGATPLRQQIEARLAESGIDIEGGAVRLLCMPRTLGVGFNPLSVYWCYRRDGSLAALIYQVHNTFGERHSYVLAADQGLNEARQACDKAFFVSPFLPMGLRYEFRVSPPGEALVVAIRALGENGVALQAAIAGKRRELTDRALLSTGFVMPAVAIKTIVAIHWEAVRLWLKGVPFLGRGVKIGKSVHPAVAGSSTKRPTSITPSAKPASQ
ncbi:MAG: DUF1365 domain-containing protein [Bradyrhizobium sp.]|nr:MAG: DUF1365 domain-containing protein [Bradyrhizobium sp.]